MSRLTRRAFLKSASAFGAGLCTLPAWLGFGGCASRPRGIPPPAGINRVLADLHVHPNLDRWLESSPSAVHNSLLLKIAQTEVNVTGADWQAMHEARIDLACVAHFNPFDEWLSMPVDPNPEAPANTHRMLDRLESELAGPARPYARLARNPTELRQLLDVPRQSAAFRVAVLHALEGGHALGGSIAALDGLAGRGVCYITITHFFNKGIASAPNAFPFFPDSDTIPPHQGLSEYGRDVVAEMERLGMLVDATHMTTTGMADLFAVATRPFFSSHASARALGDHAYSHPDEHIVEMARRGGVVGILLCPHLLSNYGDEASEDRLGSLDDAVRTIRHVVKICGTHEHVGIGSDFGGYISGPREMTDLGEIELLRRLLYDEFGSHEMVADIMANNVIRFLLEQWRGNGARS